MADPRISNNLKRLRENCNMTVKEVSKILTDNQFNGSIKTVYSWESGNSQPTPDVFLFLCDLYNVDDILSEFKFRIYSQFKEIKEKPMKLPEQTLVKKYRQLDDVGKNHIDRTIDHELERVTDSAKEPEAPYTIAAHSDKPLTKEQQDDLVAWDKMMREKMGK